MRCPQCGAETPDEEWNCSSCRMNVYWASQHYEDLSRIRDGQGLAISAETPPFLVQAHERAMENRVIIIAANRQDSTVAGPSLLIQPAGYPQNTLASELPHGVRGFVTRFAQLSASRSKRETNNTDLLLHRRPELYQRLVTPAVSNS